MGIDYHKPRRLAYEKYQLHCRRMFSPEWLARAQARVNRDHELGVIGRWFTTAFSLTSGETRCILRFERGRLVEFVQPPRLDTRCAFGFRASPEIWQRTTREGIGAPSLSPAISTTTVAPGLSRYPAVSSWAPPSDRSMSTARGPYFSRTSRSHGNSASVWR